MGNYILRADYENLNAMAAQFDTIALTGESWLLKVYQQVDELRNGGWTGQSANAYLDEMDQEVLPKSHVLLASLGEAGQAVRHVIKILRDAEAQAAAQLGQSIVSSSDALPAWRDMSLSPYKNGSVPLYMLDLDDPNFDSEQFVRNLDTEGRPILFMVHGFTESDDGVRNRYSQASDWYSQAYGHLPESERPVMVGIDWDAANPNTLKGAVLGAAANAAEGPAGIIGGAIAGAAAENMGAYQEANDNAVSTGRHFGRLLEEFNRRYPDTSRNVVAHSLGNRVVMEGIASSNVQIDNYLAVQAAVDRELLYPGGRYAAVLDQERVGRMGLTATAGDKALWMHYLTPNHNVALVNNPISLSQQRAGVQLYPMTQFDFNLQRNHYSYDMPIIRNIAGDFFGVSGEGFRKHK